MPLILKNIIFLPILCIVPRFSLSLQKIDCTRHKFTNSQIHKFTNSQIHKFAFSPFHDFVFDENTTISPFHLFTFSPFHDSGIDENTTISPFHLFTKVPGCEIDFTTKTYLRGMLTSSISRNDAVALYLAPDGNNLTAVAVAAWTAGLFSLLPWNLDNLARCALQTLTLQCPVIGIGVGAGGYIDRITPSHCRRGREDKEE